MLNWLSIAAGILALAGNWNEGSTRTGTRTQDQLIKSQLLYQLSYPRLHFPRAGAGRIEVDRGLGKLIFETNPSFYDFPVLAGQVAASRRRPPNSHFAPGG